MVSQCKRKIQFDIYKEMPIYIFGLSAVCIPGEHKIARWIGCKCQVENSVITNKLIATSSFLSPKNSFALILSVLSFSFSFFLDYVSICVQTD